MPLDQGFFKIKLDEKNKEISSVITEIENKRKKITSLEKEIKNMFKEIELLDEKRIMLGIEYGILQNLHDQA